LLVLAALGACGGDDKSSSSAAHFDESACPFVVDASQVQGTTMRCGVLYTPEVHASASNYIQVPVLIFKGRNTTLPPMVNLSGGPGQSWADLGLDKITAGDTQSFPMDVVFIEQRGSGLSRPRLDCPAQGSQESDANFATRCESDLRAQGVNVTAYSIQEMADDVATFQSVLGYPKIVLDGVSYGTAWGLQILRAHSSIVSSAILDSVVNPAIPVFSASASATDAAFSAAFSACASNNSCNSAYGDIKSKMTAALASLKAKPLTVAGSTTTYTDGAMFGDAVSVLAFAPDLLPRLIGAITTATTNGSGTLLYDSDINAITGGDTQAISGRAVGQTISVLCTDNQFVTLSQVQSDLASVNPAFSTYLDQSGFIPICQAWKYQQRSMSEYSAVTSSVTTLLVSGSFDPLTSPVWAQQASTTLSKGYWVEFPGLGHDEGASTNSCPQNILSRFLSSPGAPDTSCVQSMSVAFAAPSNPVTVVVDAQRGVRLPATQAAPLSLAQSGFLYQQMAMRSRIESLVGRRHIQRRMAELMRLPR
jgi:pimeloyl-ACP methyl ester carboxylesterase